MSEDLAEYFRDVGIKCKYLHSDIDTVERTQILRQLRLGEFDVLIGINLLREGLDLPEVSLVAILDADKEGFLRSATGLIQTIGRAARNVNGKAILYADRLTDSIRQAVGETKRRRLIQEEYNSTHGITPLTIRKAIADMYAEFSPSDEEGEAVAAASEETVTVSQVEKKIKTLKAVMLSAAKKMDFEKAAIARDEMHHWQQKLIELQS
jgi:excinuclease ABC subunit B